MDVQFYLEEYLKHRPLFLSLIRSKEAEMYQAYLPMKAPILDVGCGDGFFANITFSKKSKVKSQKSKAAKGIIDVGLDLPDSRIEEAKKLGVYKKVVTFDGFKMPFQGRSFSTVVSNCVLEHVENLDLVVSEIYRVLKPKGAFLTTVMARPWENYLLGGQVFGQSYKNWMRKRQVHRNLLTKHLWDISFQKAGFAIVESRGYLSKQACALIDLCHYISLPSLLSYTVFKKWVLFPEIAKNMYPNGYLANILESFVPPEKSGAIFYVLKK